MGVTTEISFQVAAQNCRANSSMVVVVGGVHRNVLGSGAIIESDVCR